jgi:hypothetical protein
MKTKLPSYCPEHPQAGILHDWKRTQFSVRGGDTGTPLDSDHHYYCAICQIELCSPEEFEKRKQGLIKNAKKLSEMEW